MICQNNTILSCKTFFCMVRRKQDVIITLLI
jgi:hypothetical protein